MIQQSWSDINYFHQEYDRVDLFIVFLLLPVFSLRVCVSFAWPLVCCTEMPFPCIALGAGAGVGLLRCLRPGSENPVAVIVPELVMPNHPED